MKILSLVFAIVLVGNIGAGERIQFADNKLSIELPDGWKKTDRGRGETIAGWESSDHSSTLFVQKMVVNNGIGMSEIMDDLVDKFDENDDDFVFKKVGEYHTGQVNGVNQKFPAIYTTLDATLKAERKNYEMRFYLFVFDTGVNQYFLQGSVTKPIWDAREKQLLAMIRSIIARK